MTQNFKDIDFEKEKNRLIKRLKRLLPKYRKAEDNLRALSQELFLIKQKIETYGTIIQNAVESARVQTKGSPEQRPAGNGSGSNNVDPGNITEVR